MKEGRYADDLKDIRTMMNRSSRFLSLSGLSGISAGTVALLGAYAAYRTVYEKQNYLDYRQANITDATIGNLLLISIITVGLALALGVFFTTRKAKADNQRIWDFQTKRLLINLLIPLMTGGILCLLLLIQGFVGLLAPLTLIFYGLALVNASKYTLDEVRSLGIIEIIIGLVSVYFIGYGLLFWSIGFGILHIIYGIMMYLKYKA